MADRTDQEPAAGGNLHLAISNAIVRLLRDYTGRGPTKARTTIRDDVVLVMLEQTLTKGEESLVSKGRADKVIEIRHEFQEAMREASMAGSGLDGVAVGGKHRLQGVQRARADVAEHHPERAHVSPTIPPLAADAEIERPTRGAGGPARGGAGMVSYAPERARGCHHRAHATRDSYTARYRSPTRRRRTRAKRSFAARPSKRLEISTAPASSRSGGVTVGSSARAAPSASTCHSWTLCIPGRPQLRASSSHSPSTTPRFKNKPE